MPTHQLYAVPPFSPDKLRSAYIAELDAGKECVVVDGVQSPVYDKVAWLVFAPKGHHFAYLETERTSGGSGRGSKDSVYVVDNGKRGPVFDHLIELVGNKAPITSVFSEDGEHLGYIGLTTSANRNSQRVVVDGREEPQQHRLINQLRLSRDGKHVAYTATDYIPNNTGGGFDQQTVVVDGKAGRPFHRIRNLELSSDGSRYAYIGETPARNHAGVAWFEAHKNDPDTAQQNVVDNEKLGPRYDEVLDIQVSANGQRSGYIAYTQVGERHDYFVVDNGNASAAHDECSSLKISDDGSMLSFRTKSPQGMLLVVNNREFGPFYSIDNEVVYSADGKHWGCLVHATDLSESGMLLTDGVTHPVPKEAQHTGRITLEFRPDKGWFASSSQGEESSAFEVESATADSKVPSQVIYSRDRQHVVKVFSANQGSSSANQQVTLDNKPVGPLYLRVHHVQLSDDGQHVAFIGMYNGSGGTALTHVNFDGQEGPAWFTINGLAITPDGKHIAYSAEEKSQSGGVWHLVVDGFIGPPLENILGEEYWEKGRRMSAQPDGSVTFLAALKGQLGRYTYPAEALNFMPTIGQTASVTAGLHVLLNAGNLSDVARDLVLGPNETVYGIMAHGGEYGKGALFSCRTNGSDSKVLHSFYGDKETPPNGLAGDRENVWGLAGSSLFRYDIKKGEYNKVETSSEHLEGLRGIQHLKGLRGILPDGSLLGEQSDGSNEYHWWLLSHDGASLQKTPSREVPLNIAAIGPDGAIYSTDADSLYRQLSFYSSPILLHKFVDSPEEGTKPAPHVTFDSRGRIYGFTHPFQAGMYDAIYSVERDGSDFRVIVKQAEHLKIDALVAGDNGLLHGLRPRASGSQDFIFLTFPSTGGPITTLPGFTDNRYDHALVYHNTALFTATTRSILRLQIPSASGAAQLNPIVTIKTVAPVALASVEPVSFTTSSGETIPSAKTPDAQANAAIWHPPQPGSTIPLVSHQSSTPAKNGLTRFNTGNPAITNFGNGGAPGQGLSQQDATAFAVTNVNAMSAGDINALASFYADQVDYQDKGIITNYAVQSEFQQYFARWPQTNWQLTGAVAVQPVGPSRYQITFPVSFEAANPATNKRSAGVARETMTLEQDGNGAWKIVRERQTITSRKAEDRGRRSEREKVYEGKPIDRRNLPIPPGIPWPPNMPHP